MLPFQVRWGKDEANRRGFYFIILPLSNLNHKKGESHERKKRIDVNIVQMYYLYFRGFVRKNADWERKWYNNGAINEEKDRIYLGFGTHQERLLLSCPGQARG